MSNVTPAEAARVYQELMTADLGPIPAWYQMLDVTSRRRGIWPSSRTTAP